VLLRRLCEWLPERMQIAIKSSTIFFRRLPLIALLTLVMYMMLGYGSPSFARDVRASAPL